MRYRRPSSVGGGFVYTGNMEMNKWLEQEIEWAETSRRAAIQVGDASVASHFSGVIHAHKKTLSALKSGYLEA